MLYQSALCGGLCHALGFVSIVAPFLIFVYSLYSFAYCYLPAHFFGYQYFMLLPLFYFVTLPFMVFIMTFIYHTGETLLMRHELPRRFMLADHIHRTGGLRMGVSFNERQKVRLFWFGLITAVSYVLFWIIVLVL